MQAIIIEGLGYLASFTVAISLLMVSVLKLRIINLIGSTMFLIYGLLIGSVPIVITNVCVVSINIVNLRRLRSGNKAVQYNDMGGELRPQVEVFANEYLQDIRRFFPYFSVEQIAAAEEAGGRVFAAVRNLKVVGFAVVFPVAGVGSVLKPDRAMLIQNNSSGREHCFLLDYIVPRYRGLGLVRGLHELVIHQAGSSVDALLALTPQSSRKYAAFLQNNGFSFLAQKDGDVLYRKPLGSVRP
ncbi:MAG: hypothetical protein D6B26_06530 [Spirochaetaceae bacterium]|nr:MAG: hypothetical protein D6B26_06530 [Spirochaetaceae bacterium]